MYIAQFLSQEGINSGGGIYLDKGEIQYLLNFSFSIPGTQFEKE